MQPGVVGRQWPEELVDVASFALELEGDEEIEESLQAHVPAMQVNGGDVIQKGESVP